MPETSTPAVPPSPSLSLPPAPSNPTVPQPSSAAPVVAPPATASNEAPIAATAPVVSEPPRSERDFKTKVKEDWETFKRDARNAGNEFKAGFQKFMDWITP